MTALRWQGVIFSAMALLVALVSLPVGAVAGPATLLLLAGLILLLGVPHGAFDPLFAQRLHALSGLRDWCLFTLAYTVPALLVALLWQTAPGLFLGGFLLLSLLHFSGDPEAGSSFFFRLVYGGLVIVLPALLHTDEVARLFGMLAGQEAAATLAGWLHVLSWPWLLATWMAILSSLRTRSQAALEMLAVAVLAVAASPLVAFTVFFCAMHGARHLLRTLAHAGPVAARSVVRFAVLPMLAVAVLFAAAFWFWRDVALEERLIRLIFIGLAALTVPHMALIERVRFGGRW
ncbi:Brp/Blh family beta-carotene 15,15'-dioxygenase [Actimicrobium sp. CCC2.4]|uniref:Brp/Blh family beta-carotene 15,15'-dioxygenase n=1 Tax=Actimicrobium sp. CCC2.4 TaxID=3048606 RepID=UPI002AC9301C|nr:Brp/Blh family beta-carotene 15,15'-dioxygenase [Actimicrobium sp. CCC2.4]MEB0136665.1 Brp/Blh family beta-carotene 15,15'-dioxygenase [Actimicrobium sp. CCC2.4]WPX31652.1 Brp/Blh family beta-carotene 15,15'-dioxygenase [Actimicrobium sp. CCC2.4]